MTDTTYGILAGPYPPFDMAGDATAFAHNALVSDVRWAIDASNTALFYKENPLPANADARGCLAKINREADKRDAGRSAKAQRRRICPGCHYQRSASGACGC